MIDTTKMKQDAEEGLRIAEVATEGPIRVNRYSNEGGSISYQLQQDGPGDTVLCAFDDDEDERAIFDSAFHADAHTRAPEAYRNVIDMVDLIDTLIAERSDLESRFAEVSIDACVEHKRLVAMGVECDDIRAESERLKTLVSAAESAEEAMTRKAEEHYDRATKAELESETLRADLAQCKAECARLGGVIALQSWANGDSVNTIDALTRKLASALEGQSVPSAAGATFAMQLMAAENDKQHLRHELHECQSRHNTEIEQLRAELARVRPIADAALAWVENEGPTADTDLLDTMSSSELAAGLTP